jgi:four helix bundle protein
MWEIEVNGVGGQRSEVRSQKTEVRNQKSEVGSRKSEIRNQREEVSGNMGKDMRLSSAKDLDVYKKAYVLAMEIFEVSKKFPPEERFALTGQIRRSSHSVCLNLREAWAKRRYEAHFVSKLTDCDGENSETDSSLDFANDCGSITRKQHEDLTAQCKEVGRMLGSMINHPEPFLVRSQSPSAAVPVKRHLEGLPTTSGRLTSRPALRDEARPDSVGTAGFPSRSAG